MTSRLDGIDAEFANGPGRCAPNFFFYSTLLLHSRQTKKHTDIKVQRREAIRADKERNESPVAVVNKIG
jgi:hypothetical protein